MEGEFTLDKAALGFDGKAKQKLLASYDVADDLEEPDTANFLFQADIPRAGLEEGAIIYQWAQLKPKTEASVGDISIDCKVVVGDPYATEANVYKAKIEDSVMGGKEYNKSGAAAHDKLKADFVKDDDEFYDLKSSDTSYKN